MKIKFRGRGLKDKKLYYGSYVQTMPQSSFPAILDNDGFYNEISPESVAQFVGYDCNGDEIYEGDKVHGINGTMDGHTFTARRDNVVQSTNGMYWVFQSEDVRKDSVENEKN